ncbi:YdcF family protein [Tepidamorphus sp. 3E244]|uniref:YdcF family protein n=1 Tax=Tepidamorphus sp. 3E244 TaxID=3385498 RepID=UPI0038FCF016
MFFYVAKIGWFVAQPSNALVIGLVIGFVLMLAGMRRFGRVLVGLAVVGFLVAGFSPLANALLQPLEDRFARVEPASGEVAGIVLLGGGLETIVTTTRGVPALNEAADRLTTFAALARRYPQARLILSGGSGGLVYRDLDESGVAEDLLASLGIDPDRLELESVSRDTFENAVNSRELADPQPDETWLLVTSAFHMPRSVGCFRKAGFDVQAYPTDYRTRGPEDRTRPFYSASDGMRRLDIVTREWLGLFVYAMTGRTDSVFPHP